MNDPANDSRDLLNVNGLQEPYCQALTPASLELMKPSGRVKRLQETPQQVLLHTEI